MRKAPDRRVEEGVVSTFFSRHVLVTFLVIDELS